MAMAEILLLNPRRRKVRSGRRSKAKRRGMPPALKAYWAARRKGAVKTASKPRRRRAHAKWKRPSDRAASIAGRTLRHRRPNPIGGNLFRGLVPMVQQAAVGAVGAVAVDYAMGMANRYLPASLQTVPGTVGAGDAVKAVLTVALGRALNGVTRGMSMQMAQGALTVQADRIIRNFLPATITSQMGYAVPSVAVTAGTPRVGPNRVNTSMAAYTAPGVTPLLSAYTRPGSPSPLLSSARTREAIVK
jgi:hypothetical protein